MDNSQSESTEPAFLKCLVQECAKLAKLAYQDVNGSGIEQFMWSDLKRPKSFKSGNAYAFVAETERFIVIAFRGSDDSSDWRHNCNFEYAACDLGGVEGLLAHRGFANHLELIFDAIALHVKQISNGHWRQVIVTGHSLGGAVAVLAAAYLRAMQCDCRCINFASPRVFDPETAIFVDDVMRLDVLRVVCNGDVIDNMPTTGGRRPYNHVGRAWYLGRKGQIRKEQRSLVWRVLTTLRAMFSGLRPSEAHSIDEYQKRLWS